MPVLADNDNRPPLGWVTLYGDEDIVRQLLTAATIYVNGSMHQTATPL